MTVDDHYNARVEALDTTNGKLAAMKTARFFTERQQRADTDAFKRILTRQGGQESCEGDELVVG
ncbi:MAG: hypothetical protein L3K52_15875 [Candidatus Thiothrix sulfatifontis]|nr:MAG: hypothetical protein L3K52_15875 [Candidatus Thiothrix sulfatifontis]